MINKKTQIAALGLLATLLTVNLLAGAADARRCPRGYEDINNICYKVPGHG
jgi:hypothetical protein